MSALRWGAGGMSMPCWGAAGGLAPRAPAGARPRGAGGGGRRVGGGGGAGPAARGGRAAGGGGARRRVVGGGRGGGRGGGAGPCAAPRPGSARGRRCRARGSRGRR